MLWLILVVNCLFLSICFAMWKTEQQILRRLRELNLQYLKVCQHLSDGPAPHVQHQGQGGAQIQLLQNLKRNSFSTQLSSIRWPTRRCSLRRWSLTENWPEPCRSLFLNCKWLTLIRPWNENENLGCLFTHHESFAALVRGQVLPEDLGQEPQVQGDRANPHLLNQRGGMKVISAQMENYWTQNFAGVHLAVPQSEDPAGKRQGGRGGAREERDEKEGRLCLEQ